MGLFHRDKKNNEEEPDSVPTNSFSDIMNGLQYAVNCAQDTLQNHQIQNLTRLFGGINANILDFPEFKYARINGIITVGTGSRPGQSARIVSCGSPTHISGNELDYFFIDNRLSLITKIDRYTLKGGDHYPVILEI